MDVVVEIGGWEHECCGPAVDRDQFVDLPCRRSTGGDGVVHRRETHHRDEGEAPPDEHVRGRVTDVHAVTRNGSTVPVLRIPSGEALRGFDAHDDGHLEDPWTGEIVVRDSDEFLVTVRVPGPLRLDPSNYRS